MNPPLRVLYVDDYPLDRELVRDSLEREHGGFVVTEAASRSEFHARLAEGVYDVVLSDFNILGFDGLQVLDAIRRKDPRVPVIIVTGTGSEEVAVEAMKRGAADYVIKSPSHIQRLPMTIQAVIEKRRLEDEHRRVEAERERLEKQLRQAQKMEALGTLAGGIAHDFNNILGAIMGFTELALMETGEPGPLRDDLQQVLKSTMRARDLVQQILAFSRQSEQERKPVQVSLIVKEALKLVRASLPTTIELRQNVSSTGLVEGDPTQIHQVLMNLCTNAAHAMKGCNGVLDVSLTDVELDQEEVAAEFTSLGPGRYQRLCVADTGHGIEPENLQKIFDPFFTTKSLGEGTGLGLSVVAGIVRSCRGALKVYSEPGKGTAFHVMLPLIEKALPQSSAPVIPIPCGAERILLLDDEPALAMLGKEMLERLGYTVVALTSSLEALEAFGGLASGEKFDMLVTDLTMPQMTGIELAKALQRLQPGISVILCTGFSDLDTAEKAREAGIRGLIMKPVVMRELGELVRKVLDATR